MKGGQVKRLKVKVAAVALALGIAWSCGWGVNSDPQRPDPSRTPTQSSGR